MIKQSFKYDNYLKTNLISSLNYFFLLNYINILTFLKNKLIFIFVNKVKKVVLLKKIIYIFI